ncbi:hypothetical protein [Janthinobacterium sp. UMAB-56]|uniref:DUF6630 family protein n=1 Tax=Janthinobacterium sp. UMAB-56 TaxID=1365361 RepID=UPI001C59C92A|nr:hypothetical protein [Janthinobacterium sp. UMAB-56]
MTAPPEPPVEEDENLSDAQILKEYFSASTQAKQALRRFLTLITAQLGTEESQRLTKLVISHLGRGDTTSEAIESGILDDEGQRRGKWVLLQVDWKATEEVEWQANELLTVAGINETWHLQGGTRTTVPRALLEFSSWVKPRGRPFASSRLRKRCVLRTADVGGKIGRDCSNGEGSWSES